MQYGAAMDEGVWIVGGYQSDFAALTGEVVDATPASAQMDSADVGVVHVANAFGELFAERNHLGAMPANCFTPSAYVAIDHLGLTGPEESWKAVENGEIEIGGRWPMNPSAGVIGGGHPVGASEVRMLVDAAKQVSGTAGAYQVENARTFGTLNFGGSTATTVSFVVSAVQGF